jgi:hypothetical protein
MNRTFGWLSLTRQYLKSLSSQGIGWPSFGTQLQWDTWFRALSPRGNVAATLPPRNIAAYYPNDSASIRLDGSNNVILWEDKSGNSATNCLVLNGTNSNGATLTTGTAVAAGDFTLVAKFIVPLANPSTNVGVVEWSSSSVAGTAAPTASCFGITVGTTGLLRVIIYGATPGSQVIQATANTNLVSTYAGQTVTVTVTRSGATLVVYINGASVAVTTNDFGSGYTFAGSITSTNTNIGYAGASNVISSCVYAVRAYSIALNGAAVLADYNGAVQANIFENIPFSSAAKLAPSFTATTGQTVTINSIGDAGARISGERDLYQGTAANRPAYTAASGGNRLFVTFDGSNDYIKSAGFALSQPETVYFVGSQVSWTLNDNLYDGFSSANRMILGQRVGTPALSISAGTTVANNATLPLGVVGVISSVFNSSASLNRIGRLGIVAGDASTSNGAGFTLGATHDGTLPANIRVSEIAIYSEAHNTTIQNQIINYFASKYNIGL